MKSILLRSAALAALALGLAACGGGSDDDDYVIEGRFVQSDGTEGGVIYEGLKLKNRGEIIEIKPGAKKFSFPTKLGYGDEYHVTVETNPAHQACDVVSPALDGIEGRDVAGRLTAIDVVVNCKVQSHIVFVSINKVAEGLVITNGSTGGSYTLGNTTTPLQFPVQYGQSYGLTILTQPKTGGPCTIENGVGIMGDNDINTAKIVCP